jgi:hypothetical protein
MAKKKQVQKKAAPKAKAPAVKKKSAQQQIWRIQNKLDKPRLSLQEKRELEKKLQSAKKLAGYKGPTKREETRLDKEKRSLSAKRAKLSKKFKDPKTPKKERNKIRKDLMELSGRYNEVNKKLGKKEKKKLKRETKVKKKGKGIRTYEEPTWVVRPEHIDPTINEKKMKKYIIDGHIISKSRPDEVYSKWYDLELRLLKQGSNGIAVITYDYNAKTFSVEEKR